MLPQPSMIKVITGSDAFILTATNSDKQLNIPTPADKEFRLTITIHWEEFRNPTDPTGSLWFEYLLGKTTPELPGIQAVVPVNVTGPESKTFVVATLGLIGIHYTGQAKAHVWLSYFAEYFE